MAPGFCPNVGVWVAPNAGLADGAEAAVPNTKEDPAELDVVVAPKAKPEVAAALLLLVPEPKTNEVEAVLVLDVTAGLLS